MGFIKKLFIIFIIFQVVIAQAGTELLERIEKAGTVVNTYEHLTCQQVDIDNESDLEKVWPSMCEIVIKSDLCKDVERKDKVNCYDSDENSLNIKSFKFVRNCGIGFIYDSLKDFLIFMKDMVVGVGSFIIDGEYRQEVVAQAGEYWDSLKNYIAIEYAKEYDKTQSRVAAIKNISGSFISLIFEKMAEVISRSYYKLGCYNQEKRQRLVCKALGDFVMPPVAALGLIFKGPAFAKRVLQSTKELGLNLKTSVMTPEGVERLKLAPRNDEILRRELANVSDEEIGKPELNSLIANMTHTMRKEGGVGIAANQVGVDKKVTIISSNELGTLALINPEVKSLSNRQILSFEGCLSIKGKCGLIKRDGDIEVVYTDIDGNSHTWHPKGFDRKVVQHEVDHLNGKLWVYHQKGFSRKFGVSPVRGITNEKRIEFHRYLDGLNEKQVENLKSIKKGVNDTLGRLNQNSPLALAGGKTVEERFDFATDIIKTFVDKGTPDEILKKVSQKIQTDEDALIVYDILSRIDSREARAVISELRDTKKLDVVDTLKARGPPFNSPLTLQVKQSGSAKKIDLKTKSLAEALRYSSYIDESRMKYIPKEKVYRFNVPEGEGHLSFDVKDGNQALEFLDEFKRSGAKSYSEIEYRGDGSTFFAEGNPERPISFGIESEMNFAENPNIVKDYKVIGFSDEDWAKLSFEERVAAANAAQSEVGFKKPFLEKLSDRDERLPSTIINEGDGNIELNGIVFNNLDEARDFVSFLDERYGKSSLQGHVVRDNKTPFTGASGYTVFNSDYAQISALDRNFDIYLKNPDFTPAKNLSHHSLGPLSDQNLKLYRNVEDMAGRGKSLKGAELGGNRVVYGPVLRSEPYPDGLVGFELRQYHKRGDEMLDEMGSLAQDLQARDGLSKFSPYKDQPLISSDLPAQRAAEYGIELDKKWSSGFITKSNPYFKAVGKRMKARFPNLVYGGADVSERFFFPLRKWSDYPAVKNLPEPERTQAIAKIENATKEYLLTLDAKVRDWDRTSVDDSALRELQIAASKWGKDSGLKEIMDIERGHLASQRARVVPDYVVATNERNLKSLESLDGVADVLSMESKTFPNGFDYKEVKINKAFNVNNPSYVDFLENTVEVIYVPAVPYGHINFRVGQRFYSFNYINDTTRTDFKPSGGMGKHGFAYSVPKEKIEAIQKDIERFYADSKEYNVAPFDAHSYTLKVKQKKEGVVQFKSPGWLFANNKKAQADIVELADGKFVLETPSGGRYPVEKAANGEFCTQSLSCSTSAIYLLEEHFGVKNRFNHGAKSLRDELLSGNPDGTPPDFVIHY